MSLPGVDMFRLFLLRLKKKRNPFSPDRNHIHHLLNKKFSKSLSNLIIQTIILSSFILSGFFSPLLVITMLVTFYLMLVIWLYKLPNTNNIKNF